MWLIGRGPGMGVASCQTGKELSMRSALLGLAVSSLVALLAVGFGCSGPGLNAGGPEGGSGGSSSGVGGSGGQGNGQNGGMSGSLGSGGLHSGGMGGSSSGGLSSGEITGLGGTEAICPALPCPANPCPEGDTPLALFDCNCSGPCGCWQCVPAPESGAGGVVSSGGVTGKYAGQTPVNHRPSDAQCPSQRGAAPPFCAGGTCTSQPYPYDAYGLTSCYSDSQCTAGVNGRCFPGEGMVSAGGCSYDECFADSGCGARTPCICRSSSTDNSANVCDVGGNCAVDSDCGPGGYCSPSMETCYSTNPEAEVEGSNYGGPNPYYCHTASDLCINDSDCATLDAGTATTSSCPQYTPCAYNAQDNRWECTQLFCCLP
jgi:hypothetical protein